MPLEGMWFDADAGSPSYTARELRGLSGAAILNLSTDGLGARAGRLPNRADPTIIGPTDTQPVVNVPAGPGVVFPRANDGDGPYIITWDTTQFTLTRDASQSRTDRVVATVQDDPIDGSGFRRVILEVLPGVPGGAPATVPATSLLLATVVVPTGSGAATITAGPKTVAAGGIFPSSSASFPTGVNAEGQYADAADTDILYRNNGGSYDKIVSPLKPVVASLIPASNWSVVGTFYQWGPVIHGRLDISRTGGNLTFDAYNASTPGGLSDETMVTLPTVLYPISTVYGTMGNGTIGPFECSVSATGAVNLRSGIPSATITTSGTYRLSLTYFAANW
jgi:hypothetical protein